MATPSKAPSAPPQSTEKAPYQVETTSRGTTAFYLALMILSFAIICAFLIHIITSAQ